MSSGLYWQRNHLAWKAAQTWGVHPARHLCWSEQQSLYKPITETSFKMLLDFFSQLHIKHNLALGELGMHCRCAGKKW